MGQSEVGAATLRLKVGCEVKLAANFIQFFTYFENQLPEVADWTDWRVLEYNESVLFSERSRLRLFARDLVEDLWGGH